MNYIIPAIIIGGAIYSLIALLALGLCKASYESDEEMARAYHRLRDGGE